MPTITDETFSARAEDGFTPAVRIGLDSRGIPIVAVPKSEFWARIHRANALREDAITAAGIPSGKGTCGRDGDYFTISHGRGAARVVLRLYSPLKTMRAI